MDLENFRASLNDPLPPAGVNGLVAALWHAAKGNWDEAHGIAQKDGSAEGAWVHAYLHRVEGDDGNAGYWYHRAGKPLCHSDLEAEWQEIAVALLHSAPL